MPSVCAADIVDNVTPAETIASGWTKYNAHYHDYDGVALTNRTGGSTAAGDVYVLSSANDASVVAGDTVRTLQKCVVAMTVITDTSSGEFARSGYVSSIKSTGTINRLEYIRKSTTAKCVESTGVISGSTLPPPRGTIGIACAAASGGFVAAILFERTIGGDLPRGQLSGLGLSNNVSDATNDIDIAVGECKADDVITNLVLTASLTKRLDAAWAVGSGNGGLDTGAIANTTYHVFLIMRGDTGVVDALFSTSASAPTMPANYTFKRRIGSIIRSGGTILAFSQDGDEFLLSTAVLDVDDATQGTSAITRTLTVPAGIRVQAIFNVFSSHGSAARLLISPMDVPDAAPSTTAAPLANVLANTNQQVDGPNRIRTDTSRQVRTRSTGTSTTIRIATLGWVDTRGRND